MLNISTGHTARFMKDKIMTREELELEEFNAEQKAIGKFYSRHPDKKTATVAASNITRQHKISALGSLAEYIENDGVYYVLIKRDRYTDEDGDTAESGVYQAVNNQQDWQQCHADLEFPKTHVKNSIARVWHYLDVDHELPVELPEDATELHTFLDKSTTFEHNGNIVIYKKDDEYYIKDSEEYFSATVSDSAKSAGTFHVMIAVDDAIENDKALRRRKIAAKRLPDLVRAAQRENKS